MRSMKRSLYPNKFKADREQNEEPLSKTVKRWAIIVALFGILALVMKIFGAL